MVRAGAGFEPTDSAGEDLFEGLLARLHFRDLASRGSAIRILVRRGIPAPLGGGVVPGVSSSLVLSGARPRGLRVDERPTLAVSRADPADRYRCIRSRPPDG